MVEYYKITGWYYSTFEWVVFIFIVLMYRRYLFGKLLAIGFLISALVGTSNRIENIIGFSIEDPYSWLLSFTYMFAYILILIGITSITIPSSTTIEISPSVKDLVTKQLSFKIRSLPVILLLLVITFTVYWYFWLYHNVKELRQLESNKLSFTPGQAVGLLFVPVFNLYWFAKVIIRFPQAIKNLKENLQATMFGANYSAAFFSTLFIIAIATNGIARLNLSFYFLGGLLFLTATLVTQHHINEIWRKVQPTQKAH